MAEGIVLLFNKLKGFGFILSDLKEFHFRESNVKGVIFTFDLVTFDVQNTLNGQEAYNIKKLIR
ncbi:cold-shock protein [Pedobacter mendelii]|uniref:CSD domain-containing protein n=1 Tax=Pedobacter mendelii TaxID=1908240 RepID=A0ABQ2BGV7_9SPHI|nr:cold shock domain-containing protein [Pedobacter mendelii]GGI24222.1 hypothetical protein GCM10008119_11580 [Pedobacter mendelii]